jgi:uncharacterized protein YndB with AHSA1/START domain
MPAPFRFDRRFDFGVPREELWSTLARTDRYPEWWPWLRDLDGDGLREGAVAHCVVPAPRPLPYTVRFDVVVGRVVPGERVEADVRGDVSGPATLDLEPRPEGSAARLEWTLELHDRSLRRLATVARPAMAWAHDRVIEIGLRAFERRALDGHGEHC